MVNMTDRKIDGLLFDKDGTLFDFHATWSSWAAALITRLAEGNAARRARLAEVMLYDLETGRFDLASPVVAHTNWEAAECVAQALPGRDVAQLERLLAEEALNAPLAPAVPLGPLLDGFAAQGIALGVMTNDTETVAHAQLREAGVHGHFRFIAGFDSGFGAKPSPAPLLAFAEATGLAPGRIAMIGDSPHDLVAGRAAGMHTVGVLTGVAVADDLSPHADAVLANIGQLPGWLAA